MNRFFALFLSLILVLALAGCNTDVQTPTQTPDNQSDSEIPGMNESRAKIDYEFITMDRTKPILPSIKTACLSAFLNSEDTNDLTLVFLCFSEDEQSLYIEAKSEEQGIRYYFEYDIKNGTISLIEPQPETPLVMWTNCYTNDIADGKAIAARILDAYENSTLNPSLYHTILNLIPFTLTKEYIDAVTGPSICAFPFKDNYCLRIDYKEEDICYTYQIFCDYEDNVLEKQGCDFSLTEISTTYYGDLEEWMNPDVLTVWSDEQVQITGQVNVDGNGNYYVEIAEKNIFLIEYREYFEKCYRIYFHDTLSEYVGTTITVKGYLNNYRGGGNLYLEEFLIISSN